MRMQWIYVLLTLAILSPSSAQAGPTSLSVELADFFNPGGSGIIHTANIPGGAVFPGVGSGVGEKFKLSLSDSHGHAGFSVGAYQDFGVFGGAAAVDFANDGVGATQFMSVEAAGVSTEDWTITGGTGTGILKLGWLVSGGTFTKASANGQSEAHTDIDVNINLGFDANTGPIYTGGLYQMKGGPLEFTFGTPFSIKTISIVEAETGATVATTPFIGGAAADFSHTETLCRIGVTDAFGNPINNFQITASSGTHYDANGVHLASGPGPAAVPPNRVPWFSPVWEASS